MVSQVWIYCKDLHDLSVSVNCGFRGWVFYHYSPRLQRQIVKKKSVSDSRCDLWFSVRVMIRTKCQQLHALLSETRKHLCTTATVSRNRIYLNYLQLYPITTRSVAPYTICNCWKVELDWWFALCNLIICSLQEDSNMNSNMHAFQAFIDPDDSKTQPQTRRKFGSNRLYGIFK